MDIRKIIESIQVGYDSKKCFLISEIRNAGSPERRRVDQWREHIYNVALPDYEIIRADQMAATGHITAQVLDHIIHDDLAIIDYTNLNPNVMYEAAVRHISRKAFIQIMPTNCETPFDIHDLRTIRYDPTDLMYHKSIIDKMQNAVKEMSAEGYKTPEIIKTQFDLEPIIKDPKAFVELLTDRLGINKKASPGSIVRVSEWGTDSSYNSLFGLGRQIICPKCGTATNDYSSSSVTTVTTASVSSIGEVNLFGNNCKYRCQVCGTEFRA